MSIEAKITIFLTASLVLITAVYAGLTHKILQAQLKKDKLLEHDSYLLCIKQTIDMLNDIFVYLNRCATSLEDFTRENDNSAEEIRHIFSKLNNHVDSHIRFYGEEQSVLQDIYMEIVVSKMLKGGTISKTDKNTQMEKIRKLIEIFVTLQKNAVIKAKELSYIK
ncbi:hypothetical protein HY768_06835 [candidate division TA06 bacterium]|uniref:Uncharacterized protein n=1 Tax=candidate division TA06 bacterium TaxID=2250710 RepID=A0A933ICP0_UNCT6|nr:hypothetical protein [candidate division TA06 bacterium]